MGRVETTDDYRGRMREQVKSDAATKDPFEPRIRLPINTGDFASRPAADPINHPSHYGSASGLECIDAIRAALTPAEFRGFCKGNALKYVWRERLKGGGESLSKAAWYLKEAVK